MKISGETDELHTNTILNQGKGDLWEFTVDADSVTITRCAEQDFSPGPEPEERERDNRFGWNSPPLTG
jgi:hypothetical protein